jgi:hypothetical protein
MNARCPCADWGDSAVFGPCQNCKPPTPRVEPVSEVIGLLRSVRASRREDFTLSPPMPAEERR